MGINRPSLYAAFGNKEALFRAAIERYASGPAAYLREAISETTARAVVEKLFRGAADVVANPKNPRGCFAVQSALACGEEGDCAKRELTKLREAGVTLLRERFERARDEGDLPGHTDPGDLARYCATVMQRLAVQAASGAKHDELKRVSEIALRIWKE